MLAAWAEARASGDIPGAYWAILTHPDTEHESLRRTFGDVHRLSHLVGAANRADIRQLTALEEENAALKAKIERQQLRLFVEQKIYEKFTARVAAFSKTLRVGISSNPEPQVGPLVSSEQLERVTAYLSIGRQEGALALSGGAQLTDGDMAKGFFVPPTVFADGTSVVRDRKIIEDSPLGTGGTTT